MDKYTCMCVWKRERERGKHCVPISSELQVLTVYICVNILSPVHVRAMVNKQKLVLLIKSFAVMAASFPLFPFLLDVSVM